MPQFYRAILFGLIALGSLVPTAHAGNRTGLTRDEIKALPITERPQRLGHFYGRTVRRLNGVVGWQLISLTDAAAESANQSAPETLPTPAR